ncbi:MAG: arginine--tRNA ligase [bacterium]|nr:arginine--tRNA ligase [bacterium]
MFSSLSNTVQKALSAECGVEDIVVTWERPHDASHGDLATPIALQISKKVGKTPREIAEMILPALEGEETIEKVEIAGPGYVNIWLTPTALVGALGSVRQACTAKVKRENEAPVIVEYSQPNIAKPLGIHHILSTVIGQSVANLHTHLGFNTISINHLGDWGTQFGKLAVALDKWGDKPVTECSLDDLLALYVQFHEQAESDDTLEDAAREAFRKLEQGDEELRAFWQSVVDITMAEMETIYSRLHVSFDHTHGESFYEDKMQPIIDEGKEKDVFVEGENGALIVEFSEESNMPPAIVVKADGATIYLTRDLATTSYRITTWNPQAILYIVDVAQSLYFQQLFATVEKLGWDLPHLEHVVFGRMRFADKSMSTRKGNILKLEEVLDEAEKRAADVIASHGDRIQTQDPEGLATMMGQGALVYGVLSQNRKMDMVFDWDKALSFDGNSAPYLQYTHARARSIVSKAGNAVEPNTIDALSDKERSLLNTLLGFENSLQDAQTSLMPHILANYLFDLCQDYNSFYNDDPILKAEEPARSFRVYLTRLTADVIKTGAQLLTISVPDRM